MRIITRTVWGASLQTSLLLGLPYYPQENSTLNEKFDVEAGADLKGTIPHVKYFCIGNGGHRMIQGLTVSRTPPRSITGRPTLLCLTTYPLFCVPPRMT